MPPTPPLPGPHERSFYARPVLEVAPELLGLVLCHGGVCVRLTEVEAYAGRDDPGSHAFRGPTPRTEVMFGPPGHLYVYLSYGVHRCVNVVCRPAGQAAAVLLRAGEVVAGQDEARARRQLTRAGEVPDRELARGPGNLARALGLGAAHDGLDLVAGEGSVCLERRSSARAGAVDAGSARPGPPRSVRTGPRVGVSGAGGSGELYPWRFWLDGEATVSAYRASTRRVG